MDFMHTPNSASRTDPVDTGGYALDVGARIGQWWTIVDMIGNQAADLLKKDGCRKGWNGTGVDQRKGYSRYL